MDYVECPKCRGEGRRGRERELFCPQCRGTGEIPENKLPHSEPVGWKHCRDCLNLAYGSVEKGTQVALIDSAGKVVLDSDGGRVVRCSLGHWGALARRDELWPNLSKSGPSKGSIFLWHADLCADFDSGTEGLFCDWCDKPAVCRLGKSAVACTYHESKAKAEMRNLRRARAAGDDRAARKAERELAMVMS